MATMEGNGFSGGLPSRRFGYENLYLLFFWEEYGNTYTMTMMRMAFLLCFEGRKIGYGVLDGH